MNRRDFCKIGAISGFLGTLGVGLGFKKNEPIPLKGNINHSVCYWCFDKIPLEVFLPQIKSLGIHSIDLIGPSQWKVLSKHGINCSMCNGAEISLTKGWNNPKYHQKLIRRYKECISLVAKHDYKNLICFSGNRDGMSDEEGMENCIKGLQKILPYAEKQGVILQMELFNSKVDHPDYMCDSSSWGVELCKRLDSENFKLLYDIYHMQISEGDIIRTIQENHKYIGHFHTAGVPGRNEINETQELYYPAIMQSISKSGFRGFVAQEFIPKSNNPILSLAEAIKICDV